MSQGFMQTVSRIFHRYCKDCNWQLWTQVQTQANLSLPMIDKKTCLAWQVINKTRPSYFAILILAVKIEIAINLNMDMTRLSMVFSNRNG